MKQFVQLQENLKSFEEAGITVVAMTYDAPEMQQAFIESQGITYPMLSDIDASSVKSLDILNTEYEPGEGAYGIPYPGVFVINPDMEIVGKIFIEAYSTRVDAAGVLSFAIELLPHSQAIAQ
jgi:peroxiredoxin